MFLLVLVCALCGSALTSSDVDKNITHQASLPTTSSCFSDERLVSCDVGNSSTCPLGYYCSSGTCQCLASPHRMISCSEDGPYSFAVLDCYCATYSEDKELLSIGACVFNCENTTKLLKDPVYHPLPKSSHMLNQTACIYLNRTGTFCGRCLSDHYPLAYSFSMNCTLCPHARKNWLWYIMAAYIPLTCFYLVILFFRVNVVSGYLHSIVLFGQIISISELSRLLFQAVLKQKRSIIIATKVLLSFYGVWNFDFFKPFYNHLCLGIGILPTLALDYVIAVYPLLLMIITYLLIVLHDKNYRVVTIMWRPFHSLFSLFRRNWDIRTSVIDAYATFFLLSFVKFLSVSFDLLVPTKVYHLHGDRYTHTWALYYAGDVEYFGKEHLPYGILAMAVMCVFVILPTVTLALYPFAFFHNFLNLFPFRWYILHTFVDSFQGCYKNGTEPGTRDCRWFSAVYLAFRVVSFVLYALVLNEVFFPLYSLLVLLLILLLVVFQPYKESLHRHFTINTVFLIFYAMFNMAASGFGMSGVKAEEYVRFFSVVAIFLAMVPLVCTLFLVARSIFSAKVFFLEVVHRIDSLYNGYQVLEPEFGSCDREFNPRAYVVTPTSQLGDCSH